ncbi:MAG: PAS domain S-box protein [Cyanobacteriota bacterium]|nr:PAS domain S-box protein [Cyanobacteriota bacterium]
MFEYTPTGQCYLWNPNLVSLHLISDSLIAIAYFSISLMLVYLIQQRQDLPYPYPYIFWLFTIFIVSCGTIHLLDVWTLWYLTYWFSGTMKAITAIISLLTAFELRILIPQTLALSSPAELEKANQELHKQIAERQRIETELRKSEKRYRELVEDQTEFIARLQVDGTLLFVNDAYCRYFHKQKAELIGQVFQPMIFPPDLEKIESLLQSLTPENPVGEVEHRVIVAEEIRWMQWVNRGIYDTQGKLIEIQSVGRDISDRVAAQEALNRSEARFRAAAEASLDSFFIFESLRDEKGEIIDFIFVELNSHAEQLISMSKSEVLGKRLCELIPVNRTGGFLEKYIQVVETGVALIEEFSMGAFGPHVSWLRHMIVPLADGIAITTRDITERKQMEKILQEREQRFRLAFDNAPIGIALVSTDGKFIRVNHALCKMLGYSKLELIQLTFQEITYPDDLATDLALVQELLEGKKSYYNMEKRYISKQGNIVWIILSVSLVKETSGEPLYFIAQIQNITPRKQNEVEQQKLITKLKISNQELEDFAYVASHDLQEPLRKIQTFGDRLKAKYGEVLDEKGQDYLRRMQNAANRMQILIRDLLNFSRVTTKAQPYISVDLFEIVTQVIGDLENRIEQTKGQVEVGELLTIEADPTQIRQLLQNLIGNALKFHIPEKPPIVKVETNLQWEINQVQIMVSDNGIGFEEKYLDRIFIPFQRLHGRQQYEGTGIGLAICRKIVERHNGNITANSIPNQGTTFVITLPIEQTVDKQKE